MEKLPRALCGEAEDFGYFWEVEKRCLRSEKREDEGGMGEDGKDGEDGEDGREERGWARMAVMASTLPAWPRHVMGRATWYNTATPMARRWLPLTQPYSASY
jgi:hypothetical protein